MSILTRDNNPDAAVNKLLRNLSINIDPATISAELEIHPDYPSLLAISDVLSSKTGAKRLVRTKAKKLRSLGQTVPNCFKRH